MTRALVILIVVLVALADVLLMGFDQQTISEFLYLSAREYPIVALVAGILVGHIFWPVRASK